MESTQRARAASCIVGVATPLLLLAGLALAGWFTLWAPYAWAAQDAARMLSYGSATLLALLVPVAFLVFCERWQVRHGLFRSTSSKATKTLNWAWGLFATLFFLLAGALILLSAFFAWVFWSDGVAAASAYFAFVAIAMLAEPIAFLFFYDRWQSRNGV